MLTQIINYQSNKIMNIQYKYKKSIIGYTNVFKPQKNSIETSLTKIYIYPKYRHKNFGSSILKSTELYLNNTFGVINLSLVAWIPNNSHNNISRFYQKNGYNPNINFKSSTYDNGDNIYDLVPLVKNISQE